MILTNSEQLGRHYIKIASYDEGVHGKNKRNRYKKTLIALLTKMT
jgi:hypothetical protein